jgi:MFS family permease
MGGILTLKVFLDAFPMINPDADGITSSESSMRSTYQGIAIASYNLGCFIGAMITIFIGNPLGRKRVIMLGTSIMVIGAILQASATTLEHFIIGRIITGLGNGGNTSTVGHLCPVPHEAAYLTRPRSRHGSPKRPRPTSAARWS